MLKSCFKTTDKASRQHLDDEILLQKIYQICAGYFTDDVSDELSTDPVLTTCLGKKRLAFNDHYLAHGYHPRVCYDDLTGDLSKIELRKGSSIFNGCAEFFTTTS